MERAVCLRHETVEGDFSILADLDEVAVGITHAETPMV
jgi:hypothetical protein